MQNCSLQNLIQQCTMVKRCIITGCTSDSTSCSVFRFPTDPKLRQDWIEQIKPYNHPLWNGPTSDSRVCCKHFSKESLEHEGGKYLMTFGLSNKQRLICKQDAIPSIFPIAAVATANSENQNLLRASGQRPPSLGKKKRKKKWKKRDPYKSDDLQQLTPSVVFDPLENCHVINLSEVNSDDTRSAESEFPESTNGDDWDGFIEDDDGDNKTAGVDVELKSIPSSKEDSDDNLDLLTVQKREQLQRKIVETDEQKRKRRRKERKEKKRLKKLNRLRSIKTSNTHFLNNPVPNLSAYLTKPSRIITQHIGSSTGSRIIQTTATSHIQATAPSHTQATATPLHTKATTAPSHSQATAPSHTQATAPSHTQATAPSHTQATAPSHTQATAPSHTQATAPSHTQATAPSHTQSTAPSYTQGSTPLITQAMSASWHAQGAASSHIQSTSISQTQHTVSSLGRTLPHNIALPSGITLRQAIAQKRENALHRTFSPITHNPIQQSITLLHQSSFPHTTLLPPTSTLPYNVPPNVHNVNEPNKGAVTLVPHPNHSEAPCSNKAVQTNFDAALQTFLLQESNVINTWNELRLSNGYHSNYHWTRHILACHRDLCLTCNSKALPNLNQPSPTEIEAKMPCIKITQSLADKVTASPENKTVDSLDNKDVNVSRKADSNEERTSSVQPLGGTMSKTSKGHQLNLYVPENATVIVTDLIHSDQSEPKLFSVMKSDKDSVKPSDAVTSVLENTAQATLPQQFTYCSDNLPKGSCRKNLTAEVVCPSQENVSSHLADIVKNLAGKLGNSFSKDSTKWTGLSDLQDIRSPEIPKAIEFSLKDITFVEPEPVNESGMLSNDRNFNTDSIIPEKRPKLEGIPSCEMHSTGADAWENRRNISPNTVPQLPGEARSSEMDLVLTRPAHFSMSFKAEENTGGLLEDNGDEHKVPVLQQNGTTSRRKSRKPEKSHSFLKPTFTLLSDT